MSKMKIIRPSKILDTNLLSSNVVETVYAVHSMASTYSLGSRVSIIGSNVHQVWESLQNGNLGHYPVGGDADLYWVYVGSTNRWSMFDSSITSQTSNPDLIYVKVKPLTRTDSLALLNISASTVRIKITDPVDGVVYDNTIHVNLSAGITDWYAYFFNPVNRLTDYIVSGLPPYATAEIEVWLTAVGEDAKIGALVPGLSRDIGIVTFGAKAGIQDYSQKQKDLFGNYSILERAFNKYADIVLEVENTFIDELQILLANYRATPLIFYGSDVYNSLDIYGFYKDFSVVIDRPTMSTCNLSIEGLT